MPKPHDNPAALRALLLQAQGDNRKLNAQLQQAGQSIMHLQQISQRLENGNRQLVGFITALAFDNNGELPVKISTINKLPESAGFKPDFRPDQDVVILKYLPNVAAAQKALEQQVATEAANPQEPDPGSTCEDGWHTDRDAAGVRCPACGGKGKKVLVIA